MNHSCPTALGSPCSPITDADAAPLPAQSSPARRFHEQGEPIRIALVDDIQDERGAIKRVLDQTRGVRHLVSYSSGEAAISGIAGSGAELVLMDVRMPGMDGIECTARLKVLLPRLVILMLTGFDDPRAIDAALAAGADHYLMKPLARANFW